MSKITYYSFHGAIIENSNIADSIQHAVRYRRRNMTPAGWSSFMDILRDNNTPRMMLNYDTLDEMQMKTYSSPAVKKEIKPSRIPIAIPVKKKPFYDPERKRQYFVSIQDKADVKKSILQGSPKKVPRRARKAPSYYIPGVKNH